MAARASSSTDSQWDPASRGHRGRILPSMRSVRRAMAVLVGLTVLAWLAVAVEAGSGAVMSATGCAVTDLDTGLTRSTLQAAVAQSRSGHRLTVRGTCHGVTTIDRSLTIKGVQSDDSGRPTLDGGGRGSVITIPAGTTVAIEDLDIRHGLAASGGGVLNRGDLVLGGSTVIRDNTATRSGGGVMNERGSLSLTDTAAIRDNQAMNGGGVSNAPAASLTLDAWSSIHHNTAIGQIGGGVDNDGLMELGGHSSIHHNSARQGGGIFNIGTVTLDGFSSIHHNTASRDDGGGVANYAFLTLNGSSSIRANGAFVSGGGVHNYAYLTLNDTSSIEHNRAGESGGGVWSGGPLALNDSSSIDHNVAGLVGGGLVDGFGYASGNECGPSGNVRHNSPDDCVS